MCVLFPLDAERDAFLVARFPDASGKGPISALRKYGDEKVRGNFLFLFIFQPAARAGLCRRLLPVFQVLVLALFPDHKRLVPKL